MCVCVCVCVCVCFGVCVCVCEPLQRDFGQWVVMAYHLFLRVLEGGEQVDGLHVAKLDLVAKKEHEDELAHIFFLLVAVEALFVAKLAADVCQLLVHALDLSLS